MIKIFHKGVVLLILLVLFILLGSIITFGANSAVTPPCSQNNAFCVNRWTDMPFKAQLTNNNWVNYINNNYNPTNGNWQNSNSNETCRCVSYGFSSTIDWHNLQSGGIMKSFRSYTNGNLERGANPRLLELEYFKRGYFTASANQCPDYGTNEAVPGSMLGFAKIVTTQDWHDWYGKSDTNFNIPQSDQYYSDFLHKPAYNEFGLKDYKYELIDRVENHPIKGSPIKSALEKYGALYISRSASYIGFISRHSMSLIGYSNGQSQGPRDSGIRYYAHDNAADDSGNGGYYKYEVMDLDLLRAPLNRVIAFYDPSWPFYNHDLRRTGFTTLRGDLKNSQASVVSWNADSTLQGHYDHPTIADIDNDDKQELVITTSKYSNGRDGKVYVMEKSFSSLTQKWKKNIGQPIAAAASLGDLDSDANKEIVFGTTAGNLYVLDGRTGNHEWNQPYNPPQRYSQSSQSNWQGEIRHTAIADINLDGKQDIVFAESLPSLYDWEAYLYIMDINSPTSPRYSIKVGNGGAMGPISIANIDSDVYPEIMVPTTYGVKRVDFTGSGLTITRSTSDGKMEGAAIIHDVDKDNRYEIIYTTSNKYCSSSKTCYNRLYIRDAQTFNLERTITLPVYSRVTPAIADIDNDGNFEIVVEGRNSASSSSTNGKVIAYEISGSTKWTFDLNGNLQTYDLSPVVADVDNDGTYDVITGAKDGNLYIIDGNSGQKKWHYALGGQINSIPALGDLDGNDDGSLEIAVKHLHTTSSSSSTTKSGGMGIASTTTEKMTIIGGTNAEPVLNTIANVTVSVGNTVQINPSATDPNNDHINYSFSTPLDANGTWTPLANETGVHYVIVFATDSKNLTDWQEVKITVNGNCNNTPFNITSYSPDNYVDDPGYNSMSLHALQKNYDAFYFIQNKTENVVFSINATDTNSNSLTYRWYVNGAQQSSTTNQFSRTFAQNGAHLTNVTVYVSGSCGNKTFRWLVAMNNPPSSLFTSHLWPYFQGWRPNNNMYGEDIILCAIGGVQGQSTIPGDPENDHYDIRHKWYINDQPYYSTINDTFYGIQYYNQFNGNYCGALDCSRTPLVFGRLEEVRGDGITYRIPNTDHNSPHHRITFLLKGTQSGPGWSKGRVSVSMNGIADASAFSYPSTVEQMYVWVTHSSSLCPKGITAGEYITIKYNGGHKLNVYFPNITQDNLILYIAQDGSTYYDANLTQLAQGATRMTDLPKYAARSGDKIECEMTRIDIYNGMSATIKSQPKYIQNATCDVNNDCGTDGWTGTPYCSNNNVYQKYITYTCTNRSSRIAQCGNATSSNLKTTCSHGCGNGTCLSPPPPVNNTNTTNSTNTTMPPMNNTNSTNTTIPPTNSTNNNTNMTNNNTMVPPPVNIANDTQPEPEPEVEVWVPIINPNAKAWFKHCEKSQGPVGDGYAMGSTIAFDLDNDNVLESFIMHSVASGFPDQSYTYRTPEGYPIKKIRIGDYWNNLVINVENYDYLYKPGGDCDGAIEGYSDEVCVDGQNRLIDCVVNAIVEEVEEEEEEPVINETEEPEGPPPVPEIDPNLEEWNPKLNVKIISERPVGGGYAEGSELEFDSNGDDITECYRMKSIAFGFEERILPFTTTEGYTMKRLKIGDSWDNIAIEVEGYNYLYERIHCR
ncbi:PQQ-binding-like beta-propeller repeat protein [Candidatus Woesearchaeota archaeon]|nr:PQQ-binding-like beta-propeller repeat protein [Candidatus Woesearchaeota archaeon]